MEKNNDRPLSSNSPLVESKNRREVIKKLALGTGVLTGCSLLPDKWVTPLMEFGTLPAHATTSGVADSATTSSDDPEAGWTTIKWGGDPNASGLNRDMTWWTKIHGETWPYWHRKFPLPRWIDDKPYRIKFEFSDGMTFNVSNSQQMEMDANGPKYVPENPNEPDPRRQHPKIGVLLHTEPDWVRYKTF